MTRFHHTQHHQNSQSYSGSLPSRTMALSPPTLDVDYVQIEAATHRDPTLLSKTTTRVLHLLLTRDLSRLRSESVADELGISPTTLRRRLRADHVNYQELLDLARQYRCEKRLAKTWVPGKTLAWDLGYAEVNSFYRAFKRWTGINYSEVKLSFI